MPSIAVVIATCNRPHELEACLRSMTAQTVLPEEIVVVDDAPGDPRVPAVANICSGRVPVRYVHGRRGGLADAHNIGLRHVRAPLVALTDDDVVADSGWLEALASGFGAASRVGCVTGCIRPLELSSPAQLLHERFAGYDKGRERAVFGIGDEPSTDRLFPFAAGSFGSGANMAFDRTLLEEMQGFDPALGAGTWARGGDDLSAFFEVLQHGYRIVYEPRAIVRHRHADDVATVRRQAFGYGVGLTAYLTKSLIDHPGLTARALRGVPAAVRHVLSPRSRKNAGAPPAELRRAERLGMLVGPAAYLASRWRVRLSS